MRIPVLLAMILLAAAGCSQLEGCPATLGIKLTPADTTIASGDQFQAQVTLLGCGGTEILTDSLTWTSSDLSVAVVGTRTGVVIGAHGGTAMIAVVGRTYGSLGAIQVTVR
jgi:Bacterial Ig-like domain (group 2)